LARILIIEDDATARLLLRRVLEKAGHEIAEAPDGEKGQELYRREPADLVITDIIMPVKDGVETIRELRRDFHDAKIIAMTGGAHDFPPVEEIAGADCTFPKPIEIDRMMDAVKKLLGRD
jgi:two-component system response regulator (stage 0 sporulation protein F)